MHRLCVVKTPIRHYYQLFIATDCRYLEVFHYLKQHFGQAIVLLMSRESDGSATSALIVEAYEHVYGCPPKPHQIITGMMDETDGYQVAKDVLAKQNEIQAVFANGDDIAGGVLRYYDEQNRYRHLSLDKKTN